MRTLELLSKDSAVDFDFRRRRAEYISAPLVDSWSNDYVSLYLGDSLEYYSLWETPTVIVSDGAYGISGFEGDTPDHLGVPEWYEPHIAEWTKYATPQTTLWFWNSEIGWAAAHPVLEKYGWRYQNCNIWNKGMAHVAGNVNSKTIRRFPVVSEVCVQYALEPRINGKTLKVWLRDEWKRTGLPFREANEACGVKDAATRKYFDQGRLWYFPPPELFETLQIYANAKGKPEGRPYYSLDGKTPGNAEQWAKMRTKFYCPLGVTNVWDRPPVGGKERVKGTEGGAAHLNQKPIDLMMQIIQASSDVGDVIWEPFGGLMSASYAAMKIERRAFSAEINPAYYRLAIQRFIGARTLF